MNEQLRQRAPDLAFEMKDAVEDVVAEREEAAMKVRPLTARRAKGTGELSAAIAAGAVHRFARRPAGTTFDSRCDYGPGQRIAGGFWFDSHSRSIAPAVCPTVACAT